MGEVAVARKRSAHGAAYAEDEQMPPPSVPTKNQLLHVQESRGELYLFEPAPGVSVTRARGHLSLAMAEGWMACIEPQLRRGVIYDSFHDWEAMTSYDSEARRVLTTWALRSKRNVRTTTFLVASRLVAMGVSTASLATTLVGMTMSATRVRAEFEAALTRRCRDET
jgi:hypothetical protein